MENLKRFLSGHYKGIGMDISITHHEAGFLSTNYIIEGDNGKYFLKCYRFSEGDKIAEIHRIKKFFASYGIPVIPPVELSTGKSFFTLDGKHYALFPFVMGTHYDRGSIPSEQIILLGEFFGAYARGRSHVRFCC